MKLDFRPHFVLAIFALCAVSSCGSSQPSRSGNYFLVATNIKLPYWQSAAAGLKKAASELDVNAQLVGPDTYEPREQHEAFERALQQNPSGILISVGDRRLMRADIDHAIARGIPVFTMDSDAEFSKRLLFIGTDNYKVGAALGNMVATTENGQGNIVIFTMPEQLNLVQRLNGFKDQIAKDPKLKITRVVDMQGNPQVAFDAAKQILEQNKDKVDVFVCLEAISCSEVANALDQQKVSGKLVIAMDTDPSTLDWIKKGFISATIAQKPYTMAYVGLQMLADLNRAKPQNLDRDFASSSVSPVASFVDTGFVVVNGDNADKFGNEMTSEK